LDTYRYFVYAHLFLSILLAGQALYWLTMLASLRQRFAADETQRLLQVASTARWPHVAVPYKLRLPLPGVLALTVVGLVLTGLEIVHLRGGLPDGLRWRVKWALVLAVVASLTALALRPRPMAIRIAFVLVLTTIVASAIIIR
jgi:hypothetical protein